MSIAEGGSLRVGVLCGQRSIKRWQAEAVSRLFAVPGVEPMVWIAVDQDAAPRAVKKAKRPGTGLMARLARLLPKPLRPVALNEQDPSSLFGPVKTLPIPAVEGTCEFTVDDVAAL